MAYVVIRWGYFASCICNAAFAYFGGFMSDSSFCTDGFFAPWLTFLCRKSVQIPCQPYAKVLIKPSYEVKAEQAVQRN